MLNFSWRQWLTNACTNGFTLKARKRPSSSLLRVEGLEDRALLTANLPIAIDDPAYSVNEDQQLNGSSVLANDTDADNDTIDEAVLGTGAAHGQLTLHTDGTFTYMPAPNYHGTDSFTYFARDSANDENSDLPATVTITINAVTDLTAIDDSFSTDEDMLLSDSVATNDLTTSGGTLTFALETPASHGTATVNSDGTFTYLPESNFHGTDSFSYTVTDADATETATRTVSLTIDAVTDLTANDDGFTATEDVLLSDSVAGNDSTTSGGMLTFALDAQAGHGTAAVNSDGTFTYLPDSNFHGTDSFTYTVTDAAASESTTRTVSITIDAVVDLTALDDSFMTNEDILLSESVATNDSTTSGGMLTYALGTQASHGTATVNSDGTFTYLPDSNFNGPDSFTYTVTDADANESLTRTVFLTISPINDAPNANADSITTDEEVAYAGQLTGSDVDGNMLTFALGTQATHGIAVVNADGTFSYTPDANYFGSDTFTFTVDDGTMSSTAATITVTVNPVVDLTATNDTFATDEDVQLSGSVAGNDSTTSGGTLAYALNAQADHGTAAVNSNGTFTYTPAANFHGTDSFTYTVTDADASESATRTVSITVNSVPDLIAIDDTFVTNEDTLLSDSLATNDSTTSGGTLAYTLDAQASHGTATVNSDGTFTYLPGSNFHGSDSFTYTVTDAAANESATRTVSITVNSINDVPVADAGSITTDEDTLYDGTLTGSDADADPLEFALVTQAAHGVATVNSDGTFTYVPAANFRGSDSFTFVVNDGTVDSQPATISITVNSVNDAPVANPFAFSTNEDTTHSGSLSGSDVDGDSLSFALGTQATHGTATVNADGTFTYVPVANYHGSDSFTFVVNDGTTDSAAASVTITVDSVNDAPVANSLDFTTPLNSELDGALTGSDVDGDTLTFAVGEQAAHGMVTVNSDGTFSYVPDTNYHGNDSFTYVVNDGTVDSVPATVTITVNSVPMANPLTIDTDEDTEFDGTLTGSDPDGSTLTYSLVDAAAHGTATVNADGTFSYVPNADFHGTDSFTFHVNDGLSVSSAATVSITVNSVNDAPVANAISFSTNEDTTYSSSLTGSDADGDSLTFALATGAAHGTVTVNADGTFSYLPDANFHGSDSFTYTVNDGTVDSSPAIVTITVDAVNDAPVGDASAFATDEDTTYTGALTGSDVDGDALTFALDTQAAHGTVTVNSDGTFSYVPSANFHGTDTFTFIVNDGTADSTPATVSITVNSVNDAPTADPFSFSTDEDTTYAGTLTGSDIDGDSLTFALGTQAAHGIATIQPDGSFSYVPSANFNGTDSFTFVVNDGAANSTAVAVTITVIAVNDAPVGDALSVTTGINASFNGTLSGSDVDGDSLTFALAGQASHGVATVNSDGTFSYVPDADFHGTDTFTFITNDGSLDSSPATVTVTVNNIPVANAATFETDEDTTLTGTLTGSDADSSPITFSLGTQAVHGTATVNADGTFSYVPNADYNGTDTFTFVTNDGLSDSVPATVTITIHAVNDAPVASGLTFSTNEDTTFDGTLPGLDVDGDTLQFAVGTQPAHGSVVVNADGTFSYIPTANYNGSDSFTYTVSDGTLTSGPATVTINVISVNDAPIADPLTISTNEDTTYSGALTGSDVESDSLTFALGTQAAHGTVTVNADGTFTYVPVANYHGSDSFTFVVNDGTVDSLPATVTITVNAVNDSPVANGATFATDEDTTHTGTLTGSDVDGDSLTFALGTQAAHGTVTVNVDGTYSYVPNANFHGSDSFTFTVNDGTITSAAATVTVTVNAVNDAPIVTNGSGSVNRNGFLVGSVSPLGSDVEGDALTYTFVTQPAHGTLSLSPDGTFTYTPTPGYNGPDSFSFKANDGQADSNVATFSITVNAVDEPLILSLPSTDANATRKGPAVQLDPAASVSDSDTVVNYGNAKITVRILAGNTPNDIKHGRVKLSVHNQGTGSGLVKIKGSKIYFNGSKVSVAKISGGTRGNPLVVTFNSSASEAAVNAVLKQLSIQASKKASTGGRTVGIEVLAGGQTAQATQVANIS
jgi:VCBS repeat-containing protein